MPVVTALTAAATADGEDAGSSNTPLGRRARARAAGYAALVSGPPRPASDAPDGVRLEILTAAGVQLVNDLIVRRGLTWTVEHNGSGSTGFSSVLDDLEDRGLDPEVLFAADNLVRVHYGDDAGGLARPYGVAEGIITSAPPVQDESGTWSVQVACPGSYDVLDFGVLWPPTGATGDTREFSYTAGQTSPSWVPEEWGKPVVKLVRSSKRWKPKKRPKGWPEKQAAWCWSTDPDKNLSGGGAVLGTGQDANQFVGTFTLASAGKVRIYAAGDRDLKLYLDGARIVSKKPGWKKTSQVTRQLAAGVHTLSAEVTQVAGIGGGYLAAVALLNTKGGVASWLYRTGKDSTQIKTAAGYVAQVPLPPDGWYPAAVLHTHVTEAAGRGVEFHAGGAGVALAFTPTHDSSGSAWTAKGPAEHEIGISGAELGEKVRAGGADVAMLPGLRLAAWRARGWDLRDRVIVSLPAATRWTSRAWPRVRTVGLVRHESGWTGATTDDPGLLADFGRRELTLSGGGVDGDLQADVFAQQAITTAASPEETIEVEITSADITAGAPCPHRDFDVADTILVATRGGYTPVKVMAITGVEQDSSVLRFTVAGYPVP